jgi:hypothetical protein
VISHIRDYCHSGNPQLPNFPGDCLSAVSDKIIDRNTTRTMMRQRKCDSAASPLTRSRNKRYLSA